MKHSTPNLDTAMASIVPTAEAEASAAVLIGEIDAQLPDLLKSEHRPIRSLAELYRTLRFGGR